VLEVVCRDVRKVEPVTLKRPPATILELVEIIPPTVRFWITDKLDAMRFVKFAVPPTARFPPVDKFC
jgi:hypothetical protein